MALFGKSKNPRHAVAEATRLEADTRPPVAALQEAPTRPGPRPASGSVPEEVVTRQIGPRWLHRLIRLDWRRLILVALFSFVCVASVSFTLLWQFDDNLVARQLPGEVALADWMAPKSHSYISAIKTKELGDAAAASSANRVLKRDINIVGQQREKLISLLDTFSQARSGLNEASDVATLAANPTVAPARLERQQVAALLNLPDSTWTQLNQETRTAFSIIMNRDIAPEEMTASLNLLRDAIYVPYTLTPTFSQLDEGGRELTVALVKPFIKANMTLDEEAARKRQDEARNKVGPATVDLVKGTAIVRRGDVLTPFNIEQLQELGLRNNNYSLSLVVGTVGTVALLVLLLVFYCSLLANGVWTSPRWLGFLALCVLVAAVGIRLLIVDAGKDSHLPYLLPLATITMVIAALFDVHLALFLAALLAFLAGLVSGTPELGAVFFAGGSAGALTIRKAEHTSVFAYAGVVVTVVQFVLGLFGVLLNRSLGSSDVSTLFFFSLFNGLISASLAFLCFSVLGKLFGVATVLQLLELAHPNQPLLRRLIREAPGTYHHSVMVSNLAEQAAERVSDNALLARVGAYYHDIGKLTRPSYFIDNQAGGANIHDTLDPRESAKQIKAHVLDGVALARQHNLPRKVVDIIHQHHGTCTISFFYQKALKEGLDVNELDFRYPGPKPQTKVAAIVMLADGCEAAVRANVQSGRIQTGPKVAGPGVADPDHAFAAKTLTIREVVNKIIDDRIHDNQLSECDLTLRDVEDIRNLFVEILAGIYHPRIVYPDKEPVAAAAPPPVVTATAREVSMSLATLVPEPVGAGVGLGAADGGVGSISPFPDSLAPLSRPAQDEPDLPSPEPPPTRAGKGKGIGGAGRRLGDS